MQTLKDYLVDCESKRRRMRDRPSNAVLVELRALIEQHVEESRSSQRWEESRSSGRSEENQGPPEPESP